MTDSERAIKIIKSECYIFDMLDLDRTRMVNTALDMAVKALGTPPSDNWEKYSDRLWKEAYERGKAEASVRNAGKWIKYGVPRCNEQHYQCTNCEYYINLGMWGKLYTKQFRYCPNCGAKMEVEE